MNVAEQRRISWERGANLLPTHLNTGDLMRLFGVSQNTVLRWHHEADLEADIPPTGSRKAFRYPRQRVVDFARKHDLELNLEAVDIQDSLEPATS